MAQYKSFVQEDSQKAIAKKAKKMRSVKEDFSHSQIGLIFFGEVQQQLNYILKNTFPLLFFIYYYLKHIYIYIL